MPRRRYEENGDAMQSGPAASGQRGRPAWIDCWASLTAADYRDVLAGIPLPTLLVYGGASNLWHQRWPTMCTTASPTPLLHIYEDVDHAPHLWRAMLCE